MSKHSQHKWTLIIVILGAVLLGGCAGSEQAVSSRKKAPESQVETAERAARTEDPGEALRILQRAGGEMGPVQLTLRGILLAETGRYARAASTTRSALRLVEEEKGLATEDTDLPRFRPLPDQHFDDDLPAVTTERDLLKTLQKAVHRRATNEDLLRALKERPVPVRYPPIYEGGAGLTLEVLRQHFGDATFRLRVLPYRSLSAEEGPRPRAQKAQVRRRIAAQNLIVTAILARDVTHLKRGREALRSVPEGESGGNGPSARAQAARRSGLYLALADYLTGKDIRATRLPQKARRLLGAAR